MAKKKAPIIVDEGAVYRTLDIVRALLTLDAVEYEYIVDGSRVSVGKGWLVRVFYSRDSATLVVNNCLYINVSSFDYLKFYKNERGQLAMTLHSDNSELRLTVPDEEVKPLRTVERLRRIEDEEFEFQFYHQEYEDD